MVIDPIYKKKNPESAKRKVDTASTPLLFPFMLRSVPNIIKGIYAIACVKII